MQNVIKRRKEAFFLMETGMGEHLQKPKPDSIHSTAA
jgi:hypothetical protein